MTVASPEFVALLRQMPKAELHCHLDGSLRPRTLLDLAAERQVTLPALTPGELAQWMRVDDARHLEDYLARFEVTLSVMQDAPALTRIAHELVIDAAGDGVRYIEVRFCPMLNTREGLAAHDAVNAVLRGLAKGERETGTLARVIVCALRSLPDPHVREMAELAVSFKGKGVVAFDLAGGEAGNPASLHAEAFEFARMHDLAVTVHAGEGAGPESIREAVHHCGANRIGHGTRLHEDPSLLQYVIDRRLPLEVCPTSNVQTRVTDRFSEHPLALYVERGVVVTISTDNRMMSGVTLTDEYVSCAEHLGFGLPTLGKLSLAAFDAAFLPWADRARLRDSAALEITALLQEAAIAGLAS